MRERILKAAIQDYRERVDAYAGKIHEEASCDKWTTAHSLEVAFDHIHQ